MDTRPSKQAKERTAKRTTSGTSADRENVPSNDVHPPHPIAEGLSTLSPLTPNWDAQHTILRLQSYAGNQAVQRLLSQNGLALQRQGHQEDWSVVPNVGNRVSLEIDGKLLSLTESKAQVGFNVGTDWHDAVVAVTASGKLAAMVDAQLGTLNAGGAHTIYRVRRAKLSPSRKPPGDMEVELRGDSFGALDTGVRILNHPGGQPVAPDKLPDEIKKSLVPSESDISLEGSMWVYTEFAYQGESVRKGRWAQSRTFADIGVRHQELATETEKLPAGELKTKVEQLLPLFTAVSTHEGSFNATSGASDNTGSLGIFQWGARKNQNVSSDSSLYVLFHDLYTRAQAAQAVKDAGKNPSDEQQLYINAWAQCTARGLSFGADGQILLNGHAVTGAALEQRMHTQMATGSLRTYQMIASLDWIDKFKQTVVRPGVYGASKIGNKYDEPAGSNGGHMVHLTHDKVTVELTTEAAPVVGDALNTEESLAKAVILGVNRPHFVETSLWAALVSGDPQAQATADMQVLHREINAAVTAGKLTRKKVYTAEDIAALGGDAQNAYNGLKGIVWPDLSKADKGKLIGEFEAQAMHLYKASDAKTFQRERRFATVKAAFEAQE
jgi:hypothetical protein